LPALVNLAILLTDTGRHTEAVETWRTVLRVDPGNATARRVLRELDPSASLPERAGAHEREVED
jgi:cytochrome c-type biogenesis protein CcmH/NrfG